MNFRIPKNDDKYHWTNHVAGKMRYYGLSESKIKRIIRFPTRKELGVAPKTTAVMQSAGSGKSPYEIWVMYQEKNQKSKIKNQNKKLKFINKKTIIISAWKYPGISPIGKKIPIPDDIAAELEDILIS